MNFSKIKNSILKKKNGILAILILMTFFLDRFSKIKIINEFSERSYFLNDFINLNLIWNTGVGFGLLSSTSSIFYNLITGFIIIILCILFYLSIISKNIERFIFAIIIGGALGNLYDRIVYNAVPDFIDLHYNEFHWFTFNIADIFITMGVIIFITRGVFEKN